MSRFDTSAVFLKGLYCEASGVTVGTCELACELDRLVIDRKLPSAEADDYLRTRMKKPAQCSVSPVTQTADTRRHGNRIFTPPAKYDWQLITENATGTVPHRRE